MNKTQLIGRLTKDVQLKATSSGKSVTTFTLAVDRRKKDAGADFIACVAWDKTAELMDRYLHKGSKVGVTGHIQTRSYEKDGQKVFVTEVVAEEVDFLDPRQQDAYAQTAQQPVSQPYPPQTAQQPVSQPYPPQTAQQPVSQPYPPQTGNYANASQYGAQNGSQDFYDEDIPF